MGQQGTVAVIGAGIIGTAIACALAREGRAVVLIDRQDPGVGGASFGNAGHIATELLEPLPSPGLLLGFWRQLFAFGGALDVPVKRVPAFMPWAMRFAAAAFRRPQNTRVLAPFARPAVAALESMLRDIGRLDLLKQNGHYELWFGSAARKQAAAQALAMEKLEVPTQAAPAELLHAAGQAAHAPAVAGLWFPKCAHVLDPLEVVRAFATAAIASGARIERRDVKAITVSGENLEMHSDGSTITAQSAIVCAGAWSAPLMRPFGLRVPLEAARGYHVEMPGARPIVDAPLLYSNHNILVTPMAGRLRATSYMEFAGTDAPQDPRKPARLRSTLTALGYTPPAGPSWVGPRPVLPDYLPAMGRVAGVPNLAYAFGHQHIGLTLSGVTAGAMADLMAGRAPRVDISAFDLRRFG
jgi:glycine/D-amino acid oxidase-like deaminating enzyme